MADVSVRPARAGDAAQIGRIQLATWRIGYAAILPAVVLERLSIETAVAAWTDAITAAPSPRHHVFVALDGQELVGFVAVAPPEELEPNDPEPQTTVQVGPLLVEPRWGRRGHGSRLLAAAIDQARTDGNTRAIAWLPEGDSASRGLFASAGWAADGYARTLDTGAGELREVRIHTTVAD